jgi:hypothetical protein
MYSGVAAKKNSSPLLHRACVYATLLELHFLYKVSLDGLRLDAWELEAPQQVINNLDG